MGSYSIKDLEVLSGVKAHTLRIWEQRYNLLIPERTDTNIRTYDDGQVKKLLRASVLYAQGLKISKIAALSDSKLAEEVDKLNVATGDNSVTIEALTISMIEMDEIKFEKILLDKVNSIGFEKMMEEIIYPFLDRIGVLWLTNVINAAQEHFISNLIRQKIIAAINDLGPWAIDGAKTCISFLHEEEMHEIGLLYYSYHLKKMGMRVIYLGQMVPFEDLAEAGRIHSPDYILTSFVKAVEEGWMDGYLDRLLSTFPSAKILMGGIQSASFKPQSKNIFLIPNISVLKESV